MYGRGQICESRSGERDGSLDGRGRGPDATHAQRTEEPTDGHIGNIGEPCFLENESRKSGVSSPTGLGFYRFPV